MNCPQCNSTNFTKKGKTTNGLYRRYKCSDCDKNFSDSPNQRGGQPIGKRPMTAAERQRQCRAKKRK